MQIKSIFILAAGVMLCGAPIGADASPLQFNFSGPSGTASFQLDSNPTPDYVNSISFLPGSDQFGFNNVAGTFNGVSAVASTINFGEGVYASLNIVAPGLGFTQFSGPTLFTGTANAPVFAAGTYTLINPFFGNGRLDVLQVAVPEPSSWALMVAGLGAIGAAVGFRRRANAGRRAGLGRA